MILIIDDGLKNLFLVFAGNYKYSNDMPRADSWIMLLKFYSFRAN